MKLNEVKCHLLVGGYKHESIWEKIGDTKIWESNNSYWGYIQTEHYPLTSTFQIYVKKLVVNCVLVRLSISMALTQRRVLMKSFSEAQFGYCPLVWMFQDRVLNRKINHLHERSLRTVYKDCIRERTLSMQEEGPEGFTNFSKNVSQPRRPQT